MKQENSRSDIKNMETSNGNGAPNRSPAMTALLKRLSEQSSYREAVDREVGAHFLAWFEAQIQELKAIVTFPKFQEPHLMRKTGFFLNQLEHHFIPFDAPYSIRNAFRYLRHYFRVYPSVNVNHSRAALQMISRIERMRSFDAKSAGEETRAWFGNRMTVLILSIENPRFKEPQAREEIVFFLETLAQYFVEAKSSVYFRNGFRYLKHYFKTYPRVKATQSEKAYEMIARLHQGMNYEFKHQIRIRPGLSNRNERLPEGIQVSDREALIPRAA